MINLVPLVPEIFLAIAAMGMLIVGAFCGASSVRVVSWACAFGVVITACLLMNMSWDARSTLNAMFRFDNFAAVLKLIILLGLLAAIALSVRYLKDQDIQRFEYPVLVLLSGVGMMLMVSANNMLSLYVGLELQSLSLYVLAAINRNSLRGAEAGIKYFVLGALSSGLLLFGISLIYGFSGTLDFDAIASFLSSAEDIPFGITFGLVFMLAGLAFKISAVPFHMWTPDVYQGAPTSVTAFFAMVPKIAAFALLIRLLFGPFGMLVEQWVQILYFLSAASMIVGAFAAIAQENIKRLLAYSSIGHMGYALIGLVAASETGVAAVILYLLIYMVMSAGVFAVVLSMRRDGLSVYKISDLSGLSEHSPAMAYGLAILMLSMAGIPPLAGFFGKLVIFESAIEQGYYVLAVLGVLSSVVAAYYYLRIIKVMFFDAAADAFDGDLPFARRAVLLISIVFVFGFVFKPAPIMQSVQDAAASLFFIESTDAVEEPILDIEGVIERLEDNLEEVLDKKPDADEVDIGIDLGDDSAQQGQKDAPISPEQQ
ncbi:MAG: NADH-quinone oxidoreductase subunit NuoN [Bdellovibrionales bacterium]